MTVRSLGCIKGQLKTTALKDSELEKIAKDYRAKLRIAEKAAGGTQKAQVASELAQRMAAVKRAEAARQKRNAAQNAILQRAVLDRSAQYELPSLALQSALAPSNFGVPASRYSVETVQHSYRGKYLPPMATEIEEAGLLHYVQTRLADVLDPRQEGEGIIDREFAIELGELSKTDGKPGKTGNEDAKKLAEIVYKKQELKRADENNLGAMVGKVEGYVVTQYHNMHLVKAVPFEEWRKDAESAYGSPQTLERLELTDDPVKDEAIITEFYKEVYDNIVLGHWEFHTADESGFRGSGNKAKQLSAHRVMHPRSIEEWWPYHQKYSGKTVWQNIASEFNRGAKTNGLMEILGTVPEANFNAIVAAMKADRRKQGLPPDPALDDFAFTSRLFDVVSGKADIPVDLNLAKIGENLRAFQNSTKLGGVVAAAIPADTVLVGHRLQDTFGRGLLEGIGEHLQTRMEQFESPGDQRRFAQVLGVGAQQVIENMSGMSAQPGEGLASNGMRRLNHATFKINVLTQHTSSAENALATQMNAGFADARDTKFGDLHESLANTYREFDIGDLEWDIIREHARTTYDDMPVLVGDAMRKADLSFVDPLIPHRIDAVHAAHARHLEHVQGQMAQKAAKLQRLDATIKQQGDMGEQIGDTLAMSDWVKARDAELLDTMKAGDAFEKPFGKAADKIYRQATQHGKELAQHDKVIGGLEKKYADFKKAEPAIYGKLASMVNTFNEMKGSVSAALDGLRTGTLDADASVQAEKLWDRSQRLNKQIDGVIADLEGKEKLPDLIKDLQGLSGFVKDLQSAGYRTLVGELRKSVTTKVVNKTAHLAKAIEQGAAQRRNYLKKQTDRLRLSKRAEPAVLDAMIEAQKELDDLANLAADLPARLERQLQGERELAEQVLESKWRACMISNVHTGVIRGGAREKAMAIQGTQPGTPVGEAMRIIMQYKQYPLAFIQQVLGRYAKEDRFWRIPGALAKRMYNDPRGVVPKLAGLMVQLTAMGYIAITMKDLAKGKTPADPTDPRTWVRSAVAGGAMGIYGDVLFAQTNRSYTGTALELAGPVTGMLGDVGDLMFQSRDAAFGELGLGPDTGAPSWGKFGRAVTENTPFINTFYARGALDYLFLYQLQEELTPGSVSRMEQRLKDERGQEYFYSPSQAVQ